MSAIEQNQQALPTVLVMMSTYNGEKYVEEQIESVLAQRDVKVNLRIADDGSSDRTCQICERIAASRENVTFQRNGSNKGVAKSFMNLVYEADPDEFDYFAFSDQDDYWLPEKLICAVSKLQIAEGLPALYYSDVCNVDANLQGGAREYAPYAACQFSLQTLAVCNWATGCTMVFNAELCRLLQKGKLSSFPRLHDSWVHLVALSCGCTVPDLGNAYIKRRITGNNAEGIKTLGTIDAARVKQMAGYLFHRSDHYAVYAMRDLLREYSEDLIVEDLATLQDFAQMDTSFAKRLKVAANLRPKMPYKKENAILPVRMILNKL